MQFLEYSLLGALTHLVPAKNDPTYTNITI